MKNRLIAMMVGLSLGAMLIGTVAASASPATGSRHLNAVVVNRACLASGGMLVTLGVITTNGSHPRAFAHPVRYTWDLTNDGVFETPLSFSSMTKQIYANTATGRATATVKAIGNNPVGGGVGSVTFSTICP